MTFTHMVLVDFLKMGMRVRAIYGPGVSFAASNWTSITRAFRRKVIKAQLTVKRRRSITTARLKLMNTQWEMTQERQILDEITRIMDQEAAEAEQFATKMKDVRYRVAMSHEAAPQPRSRTTITDEVRKQSISRLIPPDVRAQLLRSNLRARENQHGIKRDLWRHKVTIFEETARRQRKVMSGEASNSSNAAIARRRTSVLMRRLKARKMIDADRPPPPPLYQPVLGREAIERCIEAGSVYMKRLLALWDPKSRSRDDDGHFMASSLPSIEALGRTTADMKLTNRQFYDELKRICAAHDTAASDVVLGVRTRMNDDASSEHLEPRASPAITHAKKSRERQATFLASSATPANFYREFTSTGQEA